MDSLSIRDHELLETFRRELERARGQLDIGLRALRADPNDRAPAEALDRLFHTLRGTTGTFGRTQLADLALALKMAVGEALDRGWPLRPDALTRLEEQSNAFLAAAGLPGIDFSPAPDPPSLPASPFVEEAREVCRKVASMVAKVNDVTYDRGTRNAAREELGNLLHALKGAAVLEGDLKIAGIAGRLVELCRAGAESDPLGLELKQRIEPMFRAFGVGFAAAAPAPARAPATVPGVAHAPEGASGTGFSPREGEGPLVLEPTLRAALAKLRVLFVDDSLPIRKVAEKFLTEMGVPVRTAADGLEALGRLEQEPVDLVFTDLEMPRMHGYELIHEMRSREPLKATPVVVVTGRSGSKHQFSAQTAGATDYMIKPFTRSSLLEKLKAHGRLGL